MRRILAWLAPLLLLLIAASPAHAVAPGWALGSSLATGRDWHTATLLRDGSVLIAGGYSAAAGATATAERYFPAADAWLPAGTMKFARRQHVAALLDNGKVLVAGGANPQGAGIASAEIYDPDNNQWTETRAPMSTVRVDATATRLPSGKVLIAGGANATNGTPTASAEVFDPDDNLFYPVPTPMPVARFGHAAASLIDGNVLIAGGHISASPFATAQVDVYNAASGTWSAKAGMSTPRDWPEATLLADGRVLVSGGGNGSTVLASAEVYNPGRNLWESTGPMLAGHIYHPASLLTNGKVLVTGGSGAAPQQATELYDPATNAWTSTGNMARARHGQASTLLPNGRVLISGGWQGPALSYAPQAELWTPATTLRADPAVSFDDLVPGSAGGGAAHVTNTGDSPLLASGFALSGSFPGDYAITSDDCSGRAVYPGASCTIGLRFAPGAGGARGATLTFEANTAALTHAVSLLGRGIAAAPPPTVQPNALQKIVVTLGYKFGGVTSRSTRLGKLVVKGVPGGSTVTVSCPKGCLKKTLVKRNVRGNVKLNGIVSTKRKVKAGTKIVVTVSHPGMISAIKTLTIRKGKDPQITTRCQAPGQAKPAAC
jgi:hypothetical protein